MNLLKKLIFLLRRPSVILVFGRGRASAAESVFRAFKPYYIVRKVSDISAKKRKEALIFEVELTPQNLEDFEFLVRNSRFPVLIATQFGDIPPDRDSFAGERKETFQIKRLVKKMSKGCLILNFDDEAVRELKEESPIPVLTFGFQKGADIRATDINVNPEGTNFKIDYQGSIVPFWLKNLFGKEQVYSVLAAVGAGVKRDINLVEISQATASYQPFSEEKRFDSDKREDERAG